MIEAKLNWGNRETWVYDDFKRLQHLIFESSAISLSVHTLERLFGKLKTHKNYNPQTETKNALAVFLGYDNWSQFRESQAKPGPAAQQESQVPGAGSLLSPAAPALPPAPAARRLSFTLLALAAFVLLSVAASLFFYRQQARPAKALAVPVLLQANNIFGQNPHTVKFHYRIPSGISEEVFVDFGSGGPPRPLDKKGRILYKTYLFPGIYPVRIQTRKAILAEIKIFIETKRWRAYHYPTYEDRETRTTLPNSLAISGGRLYTDPQLLSPELKASAYFQEYALIRNFQVSGDHFTFDTRFRSRQENGAPLCNDVWFKLLGTRGELKMHFVTSNCAGFLQMKFGEQKLDGHFKDLSVFARDIADWKKVRMEVRNKKVSIYFEDQLIFKTAYKQPVGNIMGISITSKGAAETDLVRLYNNRGKLIFADDFDQPVERAEGLNSIL
ncbi:MAG: hypothetical protein ACO1NZ_15455 [Adhaeribacter sp.]